MRQLSIKSGEQPVEIGGLGFLNKLATKEDILKAIVEMFRCSRFIPILSRDSVEPFEGVQS